VRHLGGFERPRRRPRGSSRRRGRRGCRRGGRRRPPRRHSGAGRLERGGVPDPHRRASALRNHAGQWALPGGRVDAGESAEQAALRELAEEVGLELDASSVLRPSRRLRHPLRLRHHAGRGLGGAARKLRANPRSRGHPPHPIAEFMRADAPWLDHEDGSEAAGAAACPWGRPGSRHRRRPCCTSSASCASPAGPTRVASLRAAAVRTSLKTSEQASVSGGQSPPHATSTDDQAPRRAAPRSTRARARAGSGVPRRSRWQAAALGVKCRGSAPDAQIAARKATSRGSAARAPPLVGAAAPSSSPRRRETKVMASAGDTTAGTPGRLDFAVPVEAARASIGWVAVSSGDRADPHQRVTSCRGNASRRGSASLGRARPAA
jgi:8-oxo-dGTP pyrophosphatase MutT (NUDIX family)